MTIPVARIYLVRHGETQANRDEIIQGHLDAALNDKGFEQARLLGEALKRIKFHHVAFSSDLSRAVSVSDTFRASVDVAAHAKCFADC